VSTLPFPVPERSDVEIVSGRLALVLGGQVRDLPVLPIARERVWTEKFTAAIDAQLAAVGSLESVGAVATSLARATDTLIDLLVAYDEGNVLGGREWIESNATSGEVYEAFKQVTAAAFPFGLDLARWAPQARAILLQAVLNSASSASTSSRPAPTAGRRRGSKRS
jgi:hypothetical protein